MRNFSQMHRGTNVNSSHIRNLTKSFAVLVYVAEVVTVNLTIGPRNEDMRYHQVCESIDEFLMFTGDPMTMPLFSNMVDDMLSDPCVAHLRDMPDPHRAMFEQGFIGECNPFHKKIGKCMPGRFLDIVRRIQNDVESRNQRNFWFTHACIELDMLGSGKVRKLVVKDDAAIIAKLSTKSNVPSAAEKELRATMANQMVWRRGTTTDCL